MKVAYILNSFPVLYNSFTVNEMIRVSNRNVDIIGFALQKSNYKTINENSEILKPKLHYFCDFLPYLNPSIARIIFRIGHTVKHRISTSLYNIIGHILFNHSVSKIKIEKYLQQLGWNIYAFTNLAKCILDNNVDIIHAGFGNRPATAAMILSELTGIPFTFEVHAYDLFVDFPFENEKISQAAMIFTISKYNKKYLVDKLNCKEEKVSVFRVPINREYCDRIESVARKKLQLVSVCRLHPIKGLHVLIESISGLIEEYPDLKLILIGDGPSEKELNNLSKSLDVSENVLFYGSAGNEEALQIVAESSIFILPSEIAENGDRDGIPTSLIEAMYLKTPAISTYISGIPELIDSGINGVLVKPGNSGELSVAIKKLLDDEQLRIDMGLCAREKICNSFYREECEDILIKEWINLLN